MRPRRGNAGHCWDCSPRPRPPPLLSPPCTTTTEGPTCRDRAPHVPPAPRRSAHPQHRPWPRSHSLVPKQPRCPEPFQGLLNGPAVSPETPPHTPRTPPSTILVPLRQHPGDSTGRGDTGTRTRHCPSSPGPWAPPGPPPRHPTRVPGVSHGSHPGGLPWPPPAARGHAACPSARPAPTGRAAEPAERAGAEAAVGATQRPGGRRFASLRLLKPGKKGKNCSVGLGAAWALGVVCDPRALGAWWGAQAEPPPNAAPWHPCTAPFGHAAPDAQHQHGTGAFCGPWGAPSTSNSNKAKAGAAPPRAHRHLEQCRLPRGQHGEGGLILPPLLTPSLAAPSTQAGADLGGPWGGPLALGRAERRSGPPQYCSRSPNWERSGGVRGGRFHPEECERAWTPSKILVFCTGVS